MLPPVQCLMQIRGVGLHNLGPVQAVRLSLQDGIHQLVNSRAQPKHKVLRAIEPVRIQCGAEYEGIASRLKEFRIQVREVRHGAIGGGQSET